VVRDRFPRPAVAQCARSHPEREQLQRHRHRRRHGRHRRHALHDARRRLEARPGELLDDLDRLLPAAGRIVVAEIPPMDNAGSISRAARLAAGMHARRLNAVSRSVLVGREKARLAAFPTTLTEDLWVPKSEPGSYRNMYAVWSAAFTQTLTAHLTLRDETARGTRVETERDTLG
jgi:hypothetical protein